MLRKLELAALEWHEHAFTLLGTNEEHKKETDSQLTTSKQAVKARFVDSFDSEKGSGGKGGPMTHVIVRND